MSLATITWSILIVLASVFTVFSNLFVIIAILVDNALKHHGNYLILSLAVTDVLYGLVYMPIKGLTNPTKEGNWSYGSFMCQAYYLLSWTSATASVFGLAMIAIDRYLSVVQVTYVLEKRKKVVSIMISITWSLALIISCFVVYSDRYFVQSIEEKKMCVYSLSYLTLIALFHGYFIPLVVIIVFYILIYTVAVNIIEKRKPRAVCLNIKMKEATDETDIISDAQNNLVPKPCSDAQSREISLQDEVEKENKRRERRLTFVLSLVAGVFIVCWTPTVVAITINVLCVSCRSSPIFAEYYFILSSTSAFNSALNPLIYTVFVAEFRDAFKRLLTRCFCRK